MNHIISDKCVFCLPVVLTPLMTNNAECALYSTFFNFLRCKTVNRLTLKAVFLPCLSLLNPSDVTDTDDGTQESSKPATSNNGLGQPEADPGAEAEVAEVDSEPEPDADVDAEPEADEDAEADDDAEPETDADALAEVDAEPEPEAKLAGRDGEAMSSAKDAEDDDLSGLIQNEDAITLDVDGDDLLETGKHVKLPDPESEKAFDDEPETSAEMEADDDVKTEETDDQKDESGGEPTKKDGREALKKAEMEDKEKDSGKKGPSTTGASGQAKRFVFLCQFFDTTTKSSSLRTQHCG